MKKILSLIFALAFIAIVKAQDTDISNPILNKWSIVGTFGSQTWLIPSESSFQIKSIVPIHKISFRPRVAFGIEHTWSQKKNTRFYQDLKISYCNDTYVENQYGIHSALGLEMKIFKGIKISPAIEIGYMHAKRADVVYQYTDNVWTPIANPGAPMNRFSFALAPNLSCTISPKIDVLVSGRYTLVAPYFGSDVPFLAFKETALGIRYKL